MQITSSRKRSRRSWPTKVEAAYRRGDLFEKRRRLVSDWDRYCARHRSRAALQMRLSQTLDRFIVALVSGLPVTA